MVKVYGIVMYFLMYCHIFEGVIEEASDHCLYFSGVDAILYIALSESIVVLMYGI